MSQDYVEAVLTWNTTGPNDAVKDWFTSRGFGITSMQAGLLVTGTKAHFEKEFGVDLTQTEFPIELPTPTSLSINTASIIIPAIRQPHS